MNYVGSEHRDVSLILMNLTNLILLKEFDSGGGNFSLTLLLLELLKCFLLKMFVDLLLIMETSMLQCV